MSERSLPVADHVSSLPRWGRILPAWLFVFFLVLYTLSAQVNLTYDGAAFLAFYSKMFLPLHTNHPIFSVVIYLFARAGKSLGFSGAAAGSLQSAIFMALSVALYCGWLKSRGIGGWASVIFSFLMGFNASALENGTSVEVYGVSLCAVMISLFSFDRYCAQPSPSRSFVLFLSSLLVLSLHLGFCFWIAGIYFALASRENRWGHKFAILGQGTLLLVLVLLWLILDRRLDPDHVVPSDKFFLLGWSRSGAQGIGDALGKLFRTPLLNFAVNAGLILFPAPLGLAISDARFSNQRRLAILSALLFWGFYSFWPSDSGSFYLPLQPILGFFSALAVEQIAQSSSRKALPLFMAGLYLCFFIFILVPLRPRFLENPTEDFALAGMFWSVAVVLAILGKNFCKVSEKSSSIRPAAFYGFFAISAALLSCAAYLPHVLELRRPDEVTNSLRTFDRLAPPGARLVTAIPPYRPEIQSPHETMSPLEDWKENEKMAAHRQTLSAWLREARADPKRPVYLDEKSYEKREFLWGYEEEPSQVAVSLSHFSFHPAATRNEIFFRVEEKGTIAN